MKKLFLIIFLTGLLFPLVSSAGTYKACDIDPDTRNCIQDTEKDVTYDGLVPCGKEVDVSGIGNKVIPCQFCHFFVMFKGIIDFILQLVIVIAVLMFVVGGFLFLFAGADPGQLQKAKEILRTTAMGFVIIFASWIIVNAIFTLLPGIFNLEFGWNPAEWFQIECLIKL